MFVVRVYVPMLLVRVLKLCSLRWVGRGGSRICESVGRQEGAVCYVARGIFLRGTGASTETVAVLVPAPKNNNRRRQN